MFVALRPVAGLHAKLVPPAAPRVVLPPGHTAASTPANAEGSGLTLTVTVAGFEQPPASVTITVYVVVVVGLATGFGMFVALRPVAGLHAYARPPPALSVVLAPWQIVAFDPAVAIGPASTITVSLNVVQG
jgi:hypothetical protein